MELNTYDRKEKRLVKAGYFNFKNKWYLKNSSDYCIKHGGYGISTDIYRRLFLLGCKYIIIPNKNSILITKYEDWVKNGIIDDIGSGEQIFIKATIVKVIKL